MAVTGEDPDATDEELEELVEHVKLLLRDRAENNILLHDVQFSPKEIKRAITLTESDFDEMPPQTTFGWRNMPEGMLFLGVASWLMLSESFLQVRNQVSVPTDDLGVVQLDDKAPMYQRLRQQLKAEFDQKARARKNEINIASGYGSLSSGYAAVSRFSQN